MSNLLKVLSQIGNGDMQSLECEVPAALLAGLNIQADGTVDTSTLLKICHRIQRQEALSKAENGIGDADREELFNLIYDSSRARRFCARK